MALQQFVSAVGELEAAVERNNVESIDNNELRSLFKGIGSGVSTDDALQLKSLSGRIWNACVKLSHSQAFSLVNVKLRHLACDVIALAQSFLSSPAEEDLLIICKFFAKTIVFDKLYGDDWREAHNYEFATSCFTEAMAYYERIQREYKNPTDAELEKRNTLLFSIYSMRAGMAMDLQEKDVAFNLVTRAKELLQQLPDEVYFLSMKCYNAALAYFNNKNIAESIRWLEESYDIYNKDKNKDPKKQASIRTLRLLANSYFVTGNLEKASVCAVLSMEEFEHPATALLQLKLSFSTGRAEDASQLLLRLISLQDCSFDIALAAIKYAIEQRATEAVLQALKEMETRWQADPKDFGKTAALHVQFLLSPDVNDLNATAVLVDSLNPNTLVLESARSINNLLWRTAAKFFEEKDIKKSFLQWFQRALRFLPPDDAIARSKSHRIIARCHIELRQPKEALEYALLGSRGCQDLSQAQFLLFKVYIMLNEAKMASEYLNKLTACSDFSVSFLEVCAHEANMSNNRSVAAEALELILKQREGDHSRMGLILRAYIKMCILPSIPNEFSSGSSHPDYPRLCEGLRLGSEKLRQLGPAVMFGENQKEELEWLVGVAWNHGIETAKNNHTEWAHQLFKEAAEFASYQETDPLNAQPIGLLMSTACLIQSALPGDDGKPTIQLVLTFIEKCRPIIARWREKDPERADMAVGLLLMIEFVSKARLKEPGLSQLLQEAQKLNLPASKFEVMAQICLHTDTKNYPIGMEALRISLRMYLQPPVRYDKCAPIFRKLILLTDQRESTVGYYEEVINVIQGLHPVSWPPFELQWLFTQAWNNGVFYFRMLNFPMAEKWMTTALTLVKYHPNGVDYSISMFSGYDEVLKYKNSSSEENLRQFMLT